MIQIDYLKSTNSVEENSENSKAPEMIVKAEKKGIKIPS